MWNDLSSRDGNLQSRWSALTDYPISIVDSSQKFAKARRILDGKGSREIGAKSFEIAGG